MIESIRWWRIARLIFAAAMGITALDVLSAALTNPARSTYAYLVSRDPLVFHGFNLAAGSFRAAARRPALSLRVLIRDSYDRVQHAIDSLALVLDVERGVVTGTYDLWLPRNTRLFYLVHEFATSLPSGSADSSARALLGALTVNGEPARFGPPTFDFAETQPEAHVRWTATVDFADAQYVVVQGLSSPDDSSALRPNVVEVYLDTTEARHLGARVKSTSDSIVAQSVDYARLLPRRYATFGNVIIEFPSVGPSNPSQALGTFVQRIGQVSIPGLGNILVALAQSLPFLLFLAWFTSRGAEGVDPYVATYRDVVSLYLVLHFALATLSAYWLMGTDPSRPGSGASGRDDRDGDRGHRQVPARPVGSPAVLSSAKATFGRVGAC